MFLVCPDLLALVNSERPVDIFSLKYILTGGAPISGQSILRIRREFTRVKIVQAYGLSESCGGGTRISGDVKETPNPASIGLLVDGCHIKVIHTYKHHHFKLTWHI